MANQDRYFNLAGRGASGSGEFDAEQLLTEVNSLFKSEEVLQEVGWRIAVLRDISSQPELADVVEGLRNRLTQIFSQGGAEEEVLDRLKALTEVKRADGGMIDLRRLMKRDKRTLSEGEYRRVLEKKLRNTESLMLNLMAIFPESHTILKDLRKTTERLSKKISNGGIATKSIWDEEQALRETAAFEAYEEYKTRFLTDWLSQFTSLTGDQIKGKSPEEIQQMVTEHQRHQMIHLLKTQVVLSDTDMTDRLGLHDTLEGGFSNEEFWQGANVSVRSAFRQLILGVIQSFGMSKGMRYAFFQMKGDDDHLMLFGMGVKQLPEHDDSPLELVPYMKPFTRKAGFLLEIRRQELTDPDQYFHELRHYVLPFLFAFDQIPNFTVPSDLIGFFTSGY